MTSADMTSTDCYLQRIYGEEKLTKSEMSISCALLAPESIWAKGRSTVKELAAITGYCTKSVSRILAGMENKGFMARTHEKSPDTARTVTVFQLRFPDDPPNTAGPSAQAASRKSDILSPAEGELLSGDPAGTEHLSGNEGELLSRDPGGTKRRSPHNRQLSSTELKDLEPEDLEPENQDQGQNPKRPDNSTGIPSPRSPSEDLPRKVLELYRLLCSDLPPAGRLSAKRAHAVRALAGICPPAQSPGWWETYFLRVAQSSFLAGGGSRGWQANLDWLLVPSNADKVLGGNYDDHSPSRPRGSDESLEDYVDRMVQFIDRAPLP